MKSAAIPVKEFRPAKPRTFLLQTDIIDGQSRKTQFPSEGVNVRQFISQSLTTAVFCAFGWGLILPHSSLSAEEKPAETQKDNGAGKETARSLFDGKSLGHWKRADFTGDAKVLVRDGMLVMERGEPLNGVIWTGPELPQSNYELTYEAQRIDGADFFATATFPVGKSSCSLVLGGWGGWLTGLSSLDGADASENETTGSIEFQNGRWYKVRIQVTDERIRCWVDDKQIVDVEREGRSIDVRIEMVFCRPFGLATYDATGAVRKLEWKPLTSAAAPKKPAQEK